MPGLALAFLLAALLYAMVGFGGGSTYNALLVLAQVDYRLLPGIALGCNIIVVGGGSWRFIRAGHMRASLTVPLVVLSVPMAWAGGRLPVSESIFVGLLGLLLAISGLWMLPAHAAGTPKHRTPGRWERWGLGLTAGAAIGLLAGITGIGGGVVLAPLLHLLGWARARTIAAICSVFILVNSIAGLAGQLAKLNSWDRMADLQEYLWLALAVLVGGQIGNHMAVHHLPTRFIRTLTALLVLYAATRLLGRWWQLALA